MLKHSKKLVNKTNERNNIKRKMIETLTEIDVQTL